jgi:hypothetical protein
LSLAAVCLSNAAGFDKRVPRAIASGGSHRHRQGVFTELDPLELRNSP